MGNLEVSCFCTEHDISLGVLDLPIETLAMSIMTRIITFSRLILEIRKAFVQIDAVTKS